MKELDENKNNTYSDFFEKSPYTIAISENSPIQEKEQIKVFDICGIGNVFYSSGINVLSLLCEEDRIDMFTYERNNVKFDVSKCENMFPFLGGMVSKLFIAACFVFTKLNNFKQIKDGQQEPHSEVCFPLSQFMEECGRNSKNKNTVKSFRKEVESSLYILSHIRATFKEKGMKGKDFFKMAIVGSYGIRNGYVFMAFDPTCAKNLLVKLPCVRYFSKLFKLSEKKINAFNIGKEMLIHFSIPNNHRKKTATRLKIKTLLSRTNLPSFETVKKNRKSWAEKIKEPLMNALDDLTQNEIIQNWDIVDNGGQKLTDEQKDTPNFLIWVHYYIEFKFDDKLKPSLLPENTKKTPKKNRNKKSAG